MKVRNYGIGLSFGLFIFQTFCGRFVFVSCLVSLCGCDSVGEIGSWSICVKGLRSSVTGAVACMRVCVSFSFFFRWSNVQIVAVVWSSMCVCKFWFQLVWDLGCAFFSQVLCVCAVVL